MQKTRRSFVGRALDHLAGLRSRRRRLDRRRGERKTFSFEALERREVMASDPTLAAIANAVVLNGSPLWIPLDGEDADGGQLTFTVESSNPSLITGTIAPSTNKTLLVQVENFGDMKFLLFDDLAPRATSRIQQLANSGFYDKTATNSVQFHRVINDFVIQGGDPTNTGGGGSTLGDFDDQFNVNLQHNRSGLLSMAKSSDDTNDSQFFVTEERNTSQYITLTGTPTGGTFTLTYFDQTTGPISFSSTGNFTTMASAIQTALQGLSRIGAGNVTVTHDPVLNSSNQVTENRRWRVDFTGALGHQEVINLTGNAASLTGGTSPTVSVSTQTAARHLDFNHTVFGILVEGESVREAISNVSVNSSDRPLTPVVISNVDVLNSVEDSALMLKAAPGQTGEADITVTVTDAEGNSSQRTFRVLVGPDNINGSPFLNDLGTIRGVGGQAIPVQLSGQDVEGDTIVFNADKLNGETINYQLNVNKTTGAVTVTAPAGFVGTLEFRALAYDSAANDSQIDTLASQAGLNDPTTSIIITRYNQLQDQIDATSDTALKAQLQAQQQTLVSLYNLVAVRESRTDSQIVSVTVAPTAPTVDLQAGSDSGFSQTDNVTNASTLSFDITGVTAGATVKLLKGSTVLAQGTVAVGGTSITLSVSTSGVLGEGLHTLTATQTFIGIESDPSTGLNVTLDTTPPGAFTSTPPTEATVGQQLSYNAEAPGEGTAGFTFALQSPPTGATINDVSGVVNWTPAANQTGNQTFAILARDAAGNITTQNVNLNVAAPVTPDINIILTLTKPDGTPLTSLGLNEEFVLRAFVQDVRTNATGIFAVGLDVAYTAARAQVTASALTFGVFSAATPHGSVSSPGLIEEVGGTNAEILTAAIGGSAIPDQTGLKEIFRVPMKATAAGQLTFTSDPAEDTASSPTVYYPENTQIPVGKINYGTVSIVVNSTFQVVNDSPNVNEDSGATTLNPLSNDTITPGSGNILTITAVGATDKGGTVQITNGGTRIAYTPAANFNGVETFTYTVSNQAGESSTGTISVGVQPVNDAPNAIDDGATTPIAVPEDSQNFNIDVLSNDTVGVDTDENVSTLRVTAVTQGAHGTVTFTSTGVRYTPAANYIGLDQFTYTISDRATGGLLDTATVKVNVTEANDNPVATNDTATVSEDSSANIINVLTNDNSGPDTGETLTITAVSSPTTGGGTVTIGSGNTNVVYTPAANFRGTDTFTYTISDGRGGTATGTVTVTVTNTNDPPTAVNDTLNAFKNTPAVLDVLANDKSDPDPAETFTIDSITQPSHGTVTITNNGTRVTYTPATDYTGTDSFTYIIKDAGGLSSTAATVNLTVQAFIPSTLGGFVYFDSDNDGVKDPNESPMVGVTITLTGTDANSATINQSLKTGPDGSYQFTNLAPGNYTITQTQPAFTIDGKEKPGSQGGTSTVNDKIVISNLAQNTTGTGNNFGERGRQVAIIDISDFYASNSRNTATAVLDAAGNELWHVTSGPAWNAVTNAKFSLTGTTMKVEGKNSSNQNVAATISTTSPRVTLMKTQGTSKIYKLRGGPGAGLNFTVVASGGSGEGEGPLAGGEGEGPDQSATASDEALLGYLSATNEGSSRFSRLARPSGNWESAVDQALGDLTN
ncbi:MAG: Ig-like domain-containing protein [Pirellulaceae bacterium]|nr:Ig-like domain-containing protein [Pirellulaceae bacterium]